MVKDGNEVIYVSTNYSVSMRNLFILIALFSLSSCITRKMKEKICIECSKNKTIIHDTKTISITKDSLVYIPADSSIYELYLKCDSLGKVQIAKISELSTGKRIETKFIYSENKLKIRTFNDSILSLNKIIKEFREISRDTTKTIIQPNVKCNKKFHSFTIYWFWISFGFILLYILKKILLK